MSVDMTKRGRVEDRYVQATEEPRTLSSCLIRHPLRKQENIEIAYNLLKCFLLLWMGIPFLVVCYKGTAGVPTTQTEGRHEVRAERREESRVGGYRYDRGTPCLYTLRGEEGFCAKKAPPRSWRNQPTSSTVCGGSTRGEGNNNDNFCHLDPLGDRK